MNRELSLANAIAHGQGYGQLLAFRCENCLSDRFLIEELGARTGNRHGDIIIERTFALRCTRCGSEEYNQTMSIIPFWSAPRIDRSKLPVWEEPLGEK
jgi:hypothetical protein